MQVGRGANGAHPALVENGPLACPLAKVDEQHNISAEASQSIRQALAWPHSEED